MYLTLVTYYKYICLIIKLAYYCMERDYKNIVIIDYLE